MHHLNSKKHPALHAVGQSPKKGAGRVAEPLGGGVLRAGVGVLRAAAR